MNLIIKFFLQLNINQVNALGALTSENFQQNIGYPSEKQI